MVAKCHRQTQQRTEHRQKDTHPVPRLETEIADPGGYRTRAVGWKAEILPTHHSGTLSTLNSKTFF